MLNVSHITKNRITMACITISLTVTQIKKAKLQDRDYSLSDGNNLVLSLIWFDYFYSFVFE